MVVQYAPDNRQTTDKAIDLLERAVSLDSTYAEAHAKLGFAYAHAALFFENSPALMERARRETDTAERLRPNIGQVHLNRALIWWSWYEGWRIVDSIRAYRRASELDPALSDIELSAGYAHLGLVNEWRRAGERVIERDPTNRQARTTFVNEHFLMNLAEQGIAAQKRLLNQEPDERYFLLTRRVADARPLLEARDAKYPDDPWTHADMALLRAIQGRHREAEARVARARETIVKNRGYHHFTWRRGKATAPRCSKQADRAHVDCRRNPAVPIHRFARLQSGSRLIACCAAFYCCDIERVRES